jgi:predicted NBD/HSP70 family sugar kinase
MAQPDAGGEHNATLASVASGHRILIRARELAASGQAPHLAESLQAAQGPLTLEQTAEAALAGDTALRGLFAEAARHTGLALSHLVNILDPQMVIIGGEMAHMEELVMSRVRDCLSRYCASRPPVKLAISPFSRSAASVGAASMIITRVFLKAADICQN